MPNWDEAAEWYLAMVADPGRGFNQLAADVAVRLLGPCAGRTVLDVGCGDGSLARRLTAVGATVTAAEPTAALLASAVATERRQHLGIAYVADAAEDLRSIGSAEIDAVLSVLVLHHVEHLDRAWSEARRVLRPGGSMIVVIPHPWTDHDGAAWSAADGRPPRRQIGSYTREGYWRTGEQDSIRAIGWYHRTVATWFTSCARSGFVVDTVDEPTGGASGRSDAGGPWSDTPRFLAWRARCPN